MYYFRYYDEWSHQYGTSKSIKFFNRVNCQIDMAYNLHKYAIYCAII